MATNADQRTWRQICISAMSWTALKSSLTAEEWTVTRMLSKVDLLATIALLALKKKAVSSEHERELHVVNLERRRHLDWPEIVPRQYRGRWRHDLTSRQTFSDVFNSRTPTGSHYFGIIYCLKEQHERKTASSQVCDFWSNTSTHAHWLQCRNGGIRQTSANQKRLCLSLSLPSSQKVHSPNLLKRKCISEEVRFGSAIIFHLSELWKAKFSILCDVLLLVRLQEKFELDHSWEWKG